MPPDADESMIGSDADLFSGVHSTVIGNEEAEEDQDEADEQQAALEEPFNIQEVMDFLDEEVEAVADIRSYRKTLGNHPDQAEFEKEYVARELYIDMIGRLKGNLLERQHSIEESKAERQAQDKRDESEDSNG